MYFQQCLYRIFLLFPDSAILHTLACSVRPSGSCVIRQNKTDEHFREISLYIHVAFIQHWQHRNRIASHSQRDSVLGAEAGCVFYNFSSSTFRPQGSANDLLIAFIGTTVPKIKQSNPQPSKEILIFILLMGKLGFGAQEITRALKARWQQSQGRITALCSS